MARTPSTARDTARLDQTGSGGELVDSTLTMEAGPHPRRRRRGFIGLVPALLVAGLVVGLVAARSGGHRSASWDGIPPSTAAIVRGTLTGVTQIQGTLEYADRRTVTAGGSGVVTELPGPGTWIGRGQVLYRVDDQPVVLLSGDLPAWRAFTSGMSDGRDVAQLEQNLAALGYLHDTSDQHFDWDTESAIMQWQKPSASPRPGRWRWGRCGSAQPTCVPARPRSTSATRSLPAPRCLR
jgi:hypothetical protein